MFKIECHCGNIALVSREPPADLTSCNCSICHRLGALWAYCGESDVSITVGDKPLDTYVWADESMVYHRCGHCGCTTHYTTIEEDGARLIARNCRMAEPSAISAVPVRRFDGLSTWRYVDGECPR